MSRHAVADRVGERVGPAEAVVQGEDTLPSGLSTTRQRAWLTNVTDGGPYIRRVG
jgi:hypothetical protein